jgi:hypothetical protein
MAENESKMIKNGQKVQKNGIFLILVLVRIQATTRTTSPMAYLK